MKNEAGSQLFDEFESLAATIPDIVYKIDMDGKFTYLNPAIRKLGYKPQELIGKHFSLIISPLDFEAVSRNDILQKFASKNTGDKEAPKLFDERRTAERKTSGLEVRLVTKNKAAKQRGIIENIGQNCVIAEVSSSGIYISNDAAESRVFIGTVGIIKDITDRRWMESELVKHAIHLDQLVEQKTRELASSNKQLQQAMITCQEAGKFSKAILDDSPIGIYIVQDGMIKYTNSTFAGFLNRKPEQLVGKNPIDFVLPEDREGVRANAIQMLKNGLSNAYEYRVINASGKTKWIMETVVSVQYEGKRATLGNFMDITEYKMMGAAFEESERRYRELFDNIGSCVAVYEAQDNGKNFLIKDFNKAAERIERVNKEAILGKPVTEIFPGIVKIGLLDTFRRVWKTGQPEHLPAALYEDERTVGWKENYVYKLPSREIVAVYEDVTERKQAEKSLKEEEKRSKAIVLNAPIGIATSSGKDNHFLSANNAFCSILGYSESELKTRSFRDITHPEDIEKSVSKMAELDSGNILFFVQEKRYIKKDGEVIFGKVMVSAIRDDAGKPITYVAELEDITDRKQAEEALRKSEENLRASMDNSPAGILIATYEAKELYANKAFFSDIYGYSSLEELVSVPFEERLTAESLAFFKAQIEQVKQKGFVPDEHEVSIIRKDGEVRYLLLSVAQVLWNGSPQLQMAYLDITERKLAEDRINRLNEVLRTIRKINELIVEIEDENELLQKACLALANDRSYKLARIGFIQEDSYDIKPIAQAGFAIDYLNSLKVTWDNSEYGRNPSGMAIKTGKPVVIQDVDTDENYRLWRDTASKYGFASVAALPLTVRGKVIGILAVYSETRGVFNEEEIDLLKELAGDISLGITKIRQRIEAAQSEAALRRSEENHRNSLDQAPAGILISDANHNIIYANNALMEIHCCSTIEEVKSLYQEENIGIPNLKFFDALEEISEGRQPKEPPPYKDEITLRLKNGEIRYLTVTLGKIFWDGSQRAQLVFQDVTDRRNADQKLKESFETLQKTLDGTIKVISAVIELRDPYTAGHQLRVAQLAQSIAFGMNLSNEKANQVYTAALIHDIGKISTPAEILAKPGKLNLSEFLLVKGHAEAGYEILKNIDFPYPIAQWVLEHHERINGSGYPNGLTGEQFSLEAKILAVADTVEAIASHRPYRASLGINAALEEIMNNKNVLYDSNVVDACLSLFYEKGYKLD